MNEQAKILIKTLSMLDDRTLFLEFNDEVIIDLEAIKLIDKNCDALVAGRKLKRLVIAGKNTLITKEARVFGQVKSKEMRNIVIAEAVVVNTLPQKMVANFYFAFIKDFYPAKFFTDINKAKEWLSKY
ncbi:MAG: hypothetical protein PSX81_08665 [bacterium]|nr:hypothetical protein [bacterium]